MRAFLFGAAVVGIVTAAASVGFTQAKPSASSPLEGVWKNTSVTGTGPNAATNVKDRQPNINIWTKNYYSRITADGPVRPVLAPPKDPAKLTDAEKLARYEHFRQFAPSAGRYEIKGTQVFARPLVAGNQTADIIARNAGKETPDAPTGQEFKFDGLDDSNLMFADILSRLSASQARLMDYACHHASKMLTPNGLIVVPEQSFLELEQLREVTGVAELHRLDRELDHLRSLQLINPDGGGFGTESDATTADITPTPLALQMFVRLNGYRGDPVDFFGLRPGAEANEAS